MYWPVLRLLYHSPVAPPSIPQTRWRVANRKGGKMPIHVYDTHFKKKTHTSSRTPSLIQVQGKVPFRRCHTGAYKKNQITNSEELINVHHYSYLDWEMAEEVTYDEGSSIFYTWKRFISCNSNSCFIKRRFFFFYIWHCWINITDASMQACI